MDAAANPRNSRREMPVSTASFVLGTGARDARSRSSWLGRLFLLFTTGLLFMCPALEATESICGGRPQCADSELSLLMQRANVRHQGMNLILAKRTLEGRHSALAIGNDLNQFCIRELLDYR